MPFKKGDPNINRKGRPKKGMSWSEVLKELCDEEVNAGDSRLTKMQAIGHKIIKKAFDGDLDAAKILMDRIDGKPRQAIDHTSKGEQIGSIERVIIKSD
jgi:hypothetical protein